MSKPEQQLNLQRCENISSKFSTPVGLIFKTSSLKIGQGLLCKLCCKSYLPARVIKTQQNSCLSFPAFIHQGQKQLCCCTVDAGGCVHMSGCACVTVEMFSSMFLALCVIVSWSTLCVCLHMEILICVLSAQGNATTVGCHGFVDCRAVLMMDV